MYVRNVLGLVFISYFVPNAQSYTLNPSLIALFEMFARVFKKREGVFSTFYEKKLAISLNKKWAHLPFVHVQLISFTYILSSYVWVFHLELKQQQKVFNLMYGRGCSASRMFICIISNMFASWSPSVKL